MDETLLEHYKGI